MFKKKILIISIIILIFFSIIVIASDRAANSPKYQQKVYSIFLKTFLGLPDILKSSIMIFSGKRSFSNLFNDYNVKFLPETQYIDVEFKRKKIDIKKSNRNTFFIDTYENNLIIAKKSSEFYFVNFDELKNKKKNIEIKSLSVNGLKKEIFDIHVSGNKIFVSKVIPYKGCNTLGIYFSEINEILNFEIFKSFKECLSIGTGTSRIKDLTFNGQDGLLITTQDADNDKPGTKPQDNNSIFGKTIFIDKKTKEHIIFSKGHRNAQGLFVKDNIILSAEHGPKGGDEINKIEYGKNYGWPVASYGESYEDKSLKYLKSHKENGFEEPIHAFLPSIGISELIILPNSFNPKWKFNALISSLNGRSIYRAKFEDKNFNKIIYLEKIYIGERIRDIKYVDRLNFIILALERTGDLGIIKNIE